MNTYIPLEFRVREELTKTGALTSRRAGGAAMPRVRNYSVTIKWGRGRRPSRRRVRASTASEAAMIVERDLAGRDDFETMHVRRAR